MFLSAITKAINGWLSLDPDSKKRLQKLHGKTITVEFLPMHFIFQWVFTDSRVETHAGELRAAETSIRGTPMQMLGVMMTKENRQRFFADDLIIEGNAELGQQAVELFDELEIDWEEYLSHIIGDVPAHHAGRIVRDINKWLSNVRKSFTQNINEYVHEEAQWLPAREALQDFFNDIDKLRMDVDRAAARVENLQAYLNAELQQKEEQ